MASPGNVAAYVNLGIALKENGALDAAIDILRKLLHLKPDCAEAFNNLGNIFREKGEIEEAIESYKKAVSLEPNLIRAYINVGNILSEYGQFWEAVNFYKKALKIAPDDPDLYVNLANILKTKKFNSVQKEISELVEIILDKKIYIRPKEICYSAISLVKHEPLLKKYILKNAYFKKNIELESIVADLTKIPLLLKLMRFCPIPDLEIEGLLTEVRFKILSEIFKIKPSPEFFYFQTVLALQCFNNEYLYKKNEAEIIAVSKLERLVEKNFYDGNQPLSSHVLCLASYKSLNRYRWSKVLLNNEAISDVYNRLISEIRTEEALKNDIKIFHKITNKVSDKVKEQYTLNPYPRWENVRLPQGSEPVSTIFRKLSLKIYNKKFYEIECPDILVAGCGTGQHSITTAARFKGSKVLAIDLSLPSLAYAKRKTSELKIRNIDYMQADILDLKKLDKKFDIIECSGVLHHMAEPLNGWKVLVDCIKVGGLMKIGLYSELARQHIVKMKDEIKNDGVAIDMNYIQLVRQRIANSEESHHILIKNSADFYTSSSFIDLIFHAEEHRFSLGQIGHNLHKLV